MQILIALGLVNSLQVAGKRNGCALCYDPISTVANELKEWKTRIGSMFIVQNIRLSQCATSGFRNACIVVYAYCRSMVPYTDVFL